MTQLFTGFESLISQFSFAFRKDVWLKAKILLLGAILCPGSRTVCNILRSTGLHLERNFPKYHRVLNKDKWSAFRLSDTLFSMLLRAFVPVSSPLVFGIDDTIERRWGAKITKRSIYRDPVRSSQSHFVKCSGLRWLSLMLLTPLPFLSSGLVWALPVLTVLCASERYYKDQKKVPKKLTDFARQMIVWLGRKAKVLGRKIYLVADGSFATFELFIQAQTSKIALISRMKITSRFYDFPTAQPASKRGPKPCKGESFQPGKDILEDKKTVWQKMTISEWYGQKEKQMLFSSGVAIWYKSKKEMILVRWVLLKDPEGKLKPKLIASNDTEIDPKEMIKYFIRRWRVEVTFEEVRRHLGVETQRQFADLAIERSTPILMALFSIVCLMANELHKVKKIISPQTAWYKKQTITFSDVLSAVRMELLNTDKLFIRPKNNLTENYKEKIRYLCFLITQATP